MDDYFPISTPPNLVDMQYNNYEHQANMVNKIMTHVIWRWLECVKNYQSGKWSCLCYVGSLCEGVDSNQCLPPL
jgi:hypothetical protein